ncbi:MAG: hypothetical protein WCE21_03635 [Candidatus Babeliales bacterium]
MNLRKVAFLLGLGVMLLEVEQILSSQRRVSSINRRTQAGQVQEMRMRGTTAVENVSLARKLRHHIHAKIGAIQNNTQDRFIVFSIDESDSHFFTNFDKEYKLGQLKTGKQWTKFLLNQGIKHHDFLLAGKSLYVSLYMEFQPVSSPYGNVFQYKAPEELALYNYDKNEFSWLHVFASATPAAIEFSTFLTDPELGGSEAEEYISTDADIKNEQQDYYLNINIAIKEPIEQSIIDLDVAMGNRADFRAEK